MGAPLLMSGNQLLGVAIVHDEKYSIFALVYNDAEFIHEFANIIPEPRE